MSGLERLKKRVESGKREQTGRERRRGSKIECIMRKLYYLRRPLKMECGLW